MPHKHSNTLRFGGPGASDENAQTGMSSQRRSHDSGLHKTNQRRNPHRSAISGGGGEPDSHHTHDPVLKGGR